MCALDTNICPSGVSGQTNEINTRYFLLKKDPNLSLHFLYSSKHAIKDTKEIKQSTSFSFGPYIIFFYSIVINESYEDLKRVWSTKLF